MAAVSTTIGAARRDPGLASVTELRPHAREEFTSSLGMLIFLASWGMMFAGLFFAYGYARSKAIVWPPLDVPKLPVGLPALNTVVLLASSFTLARGVSALKRGDRGQLKAMSALTLVLGLVFLALQLVVWRQLSDAGLRINSGIYGGVFYAFTAFHALHVAVGLLVVLWVLVRSFSGVYTEHNTTTVRLCAMFWHFVDVVWLLMFLTIYLV